MITTGATGHAWRASVTPWGALEPWDGATPLDWWVAADDRWHFPADEASVRQVRVEGTPVTETRVRVPQGDVVHRVWTVADHGGLTIVEVTNESTLPVAAAFSHRDVLTERPIATVPIEGIALPPEAFVMPIGHAASVRVALAHTADGRLAGVAPAEQVVRGWLGTTERASRLVLPDGWSRHVHDVTALRSELALGAAIPEAADDPAGFAIALGELVRMGEPAEHWLPELVEAVAALGPRAGWDADVALAAAGRALVRAGEPRAAGDLERIVSRRPAPSAAPAAAPEGVRLIPWVEQSIARGTALLPAGWPAGWLGQSWEAYGVPTTAGSSVSLGVRWHGERPAVLWEQTGEPVELTAFGWSSTERTGETLWPAPA